MKKKLKRNSLLAALLVFLTFLAACDQKQKPKAATAAETPTQYTCPMHPQVHSDRPGSCPICGMDLVRKSGDEKDTIKIPAGLNELIKAPNQVVVSNIGLVRPEEKVMDDSLIAPGIITYDSRRQFTLSARFGGRIEKLYLKYPYQPVRKGQVVAEVYSPELVTAQRELLYILKTDKDNTPLVKGAIQRLSLLGVTANQISSLIRSGKEQYRFPTYSPNDGYLTAATTPPLQAMGQPQQSTSGSGGSLGEATGMGGSNGSQATSAVPAQPAAGSAGVLQEGQYVTAGQTLFTLVDPSKLWAEINVSNMQAAAYRKGMSVDLFANSGSRVSGKVELVQPFYSEGSTFTKVRITFSNRVAGLRIGQLVRAVTSVSGEGGLWIPQVAVLDLGVRKVAFIRKDRAFMPVIISTGITVKNWIQVKQGLRSTDEIAANAQYLIDSESFVQPKEN